MLQTTDRMAPRFRRAAEIHPANAAQIDQPFRTALRLARACAIAVPPRTETEATSRGALLAWRRIHPSQGQPNACHIAFTYLKHSLLLYCIQGLHKVPAETAVPRRSPCPCAYALASIASLALRPRFPVAAIAGYHCHVMMQKACAQIVDNRSCCFVQARHVMDLMDIVALVAAAG